MASDHQQPVLSSLGKVGHSSGEIDDVEEPLVSVEFKNSENFSARAAILPFLFPALGGLLYGYDIGATSCATISLQSATSSGISWYNLSSVEVGLVTSGSLYGALIGSVLAFSVADFLGRRRELILSALMYLVGAIVTGIAPNFAILIIGRFISGTGIGLAMHAAPMYIAETSPSKIRGQLISLKEFFIVLGMVVGYSIGSLLVEVVAGWRYIYAANTPIAFVMGVGMWWLPSSPRWLLLCAIQRKGNMAELKEHAISCLSRLRGAVIREKASEEVDEILDELSFLGESEEATIGEIFQGKCLKALIIGAGLVLFQQITGQPSVLYYAPSIFQSAGFSAASDATRVSILLGLLKLFMTGAAVLVVDRLGRRPLLLGGVSGIVISLFLLGSYDLFLGHEPVVAVVALLLYVGSYQDHMTKRIIGRGYELGGLLYFLSPDIENCGLLNSYISVRSSLSFGSSVFVRVEETLMLANIFLMCLHLTCVNMASLINLLVPTLHPKMELLNERIGTYLKLHVHYPFKCMFQSNFEPMLSHHVLFPTKSLFPVAPKIFGCDCFARDVRPHRTKLDPKSLKCIFLGYSRVQKEYRCFCPTLNRYHVFLDVTFFEHMPFGPSPSSSCQGEDEDLFIYEITSPTSSSTSSSSVSLPSCPPITQVYSRQLSQQPSGTCPTPMTSSTIDPGPSDDLPIALRKGKRTCTYPISSFVSYHQLSWPTYYFLNIP